MKINIKIDCNNRANYYDILAIFALIAKRIANRSGGEGEIKVEDNDVTGIFTITE